ncbi:glutamine amidotransferase [Blastomyces dermatitidis ATCC 26199]|nr:glutamine amidotransferase [Blastomyces dermatitidis ATCC 26199]
MCRFLVYKGRHDILLSKLITEPSHSILTQSYDSRLRLDTRRPVNGDGFGVGFYTALSLGPDPCIFTSTLPAWNCENLERLASKTTSSLIFAHVRATTEGALADNNCHPFQHNTLMWMHNGNLGGWKYIKRHLADSLADKWYLGVKGGTDSEWAFALFLDLMEREGGVDPSSAPEGGFGHALLREIMGKTISRINELIAAIPAGYGVTGLETRSLLNFAVTDGHTVVCTRYVSSKTDEAASLYFSSGTKWKEGEDEGAF